MSNEPAKLMEHHIPRHDLQLPICEDQDACMVPHPEGDWLPRHETMEFILGLEQRLAMSDLCRIDNGNKLLAAERRVRELERLLTQPTTPREV